MNNVALMVTMGGALATSVYFLSEFHQDQADIHVQSFMAGMETSAQSTSPLDNGSQCRQIDDGFVQFLPSGTQWSITLNEPSCRHAELQVELPKDVNPWQLLERAPNAKVIGQTVTWPLTLDYQSKLNTPYITTLEGGQTDHNSGCAWFKCGGTSTGIDLYPPTPSFTYAKDDQELHTGNLMSLPTNITNDNSLELGGYCEGTGSTVTIYNDSSALATVRCQCPQPEAKIDKKANTSTPSESDAITENENRCTWTYPASITHNNTYLFNIKESDWVNNTSQATANFEVIGDLYADPLNLTLANDSGYSSTDNITNNTQITISNLEPGSTWEYRRKGDNNWHQGNGNSFTLTANIVYPIGTIETRHTDAAGNSRISNYAGIVITDTKAPVFTSSITNSIDKNTLSSTAVVYQATATDQNNVRYKLSGNDAPLFVIDVNNGNVSLNDTSQNTYRFIVTAEDAAGNTAAQHVTLYINSAPTWQHTGYANCDRSIGRKDAIYSCQQGWSNGAPLPCSGPKPTGTARCPIDGVWSNYSACSIATCTSPKSVKTRTCTPPRNGGMQCRRLDGTFTSPANLTEITSCPVDPNSCKFVINQSSNNGINIANLVSGSKYKHVTIEISPNVVLVAPDINSYAITTGSGYASLKIINRGTILGRGGNGGDGARIISRWQSRYKYWFGIDSTTGQDGQNGGDAILISTNVTIDNKGIIAGGGGGGGGGGMARSYDSGSSDDVASGSGGGGGAPLGRGGKAGIINVPDSVRYGDGRDRKRRDAFHIISGNVGANATLNTGGAGGSGVVAFQYDGDDGAFGGAGGKGGNYNSSGINGKKGEEWNYRSWPAGKGGSPGKKYHNPKGYRIIEK